MGESLKSFFSPVLIRRLAADILRIHPKFPVEPFIKQASKGLNRLELLDRGKQISQALESYLPSSYPEAIKILLRSVGPEHATDELLGVGMAPFYYLPHTLFVAKRGLDHFDLSMRAQYELTKRFSAESSIRSYIAEDPKRTMAYLRKWAHDPNPHVRRLVSEGTRLRLPWAVRVPWLDANPDRVLDLLEVLKDDEATVVRRSVANNLNDLGKVWPDLLIRTCGSWLKQASSERRELVEHALRSAVKRGDRGALRLLGYGKKASVSLESVRFDPSRAFIGERVSMGFALRSESSESQDLLVDVGVHFIKARGHTTVKVFKLKRIVLPSRKTLRFQTSFSFAAHTTRVPYPGVHAVDVIVNGEARRAGSFLVTAKKTQQKGHRASSRRE